MCAALAPGPVSSVPFPEMGVFFVSREPVRDPGPIGAFAQVRKLLEEKMPGKAIPGSISCTSRGGFVIAACPEGLGRVPESSMVEVYEYDPVRYQANVVGLVAPPRETPIHWIARRVNPETTVCCIVDETSIAKPTLYRASPPRGYPGDSNYLLGVGKILKGRRGTILEGVGAISVGRDGQAAVLALGLAAE